MQVILINFQEIQMIKQKTTHQKKKVQIGDSIKTPDLLFLVKTYINCWEFQVSCSVRGKRHAVLCTGG